MKLSVENAPHKIARIPVHPDHPERGESVGRLGVFYLPKADKDLFVKGGLYRLMGCYNFTVEDVALVFHSEDKEVFHKEGKTTEGKTGGEKGGKIIHWLPFQEAVPCKIVMPDNTIKEGVAEKSLLDKSVGDIVQCERFGFCRVDSLSPLTLYYGHR